MRGVSRDWRPRPGWHGTCKMMAGLVGGRIRRPEWRGAAMSYQEDYRYDPGYRRYDYDGRYGHRSRFGETQRTLDRIRRYLTTRPSESWWFFAAGVVLALIIG